jgi:hypothetical protein
MKGFRSAFRGSAFVGVTLAASLLAADAFARDICLTDSFGGQYVFKAPKPLKPAGAIALTGIFIRLSPAVVEVPFDGAATLNTAGTTAHFGIFIHGLASGNNLTAEWTGDRTFAGSGFYDNAGTYNPGGLISFTTVSCSSVGIP